MKIVLILGNYLPGKNGGIENYTHWLAGILIRHHFEVEIAALNVSEPENYFYRGIKVNNLKNDFSSFETLLSTGNFDICHFHEYSENGGIEIPWFRKAKVFCKKVFFTFHLPYFTCYKNDFRYRGIEDCNVFSDSKRCTECVIADKIGYKKLGESDIVLKSVIRVLNFTGTTKNLEERIKQKYKTLDELILCCDRIFIIADWFKKILDENGYDLSSIGRIPNKPQLTVRAPTTQKTVIKKRLIFAGRIQQQKGLHLLCSALRSLKNRDIQLDVYGNIRDDSYFKQCMSEFRFNLKGSVNQDFLLSTFKEYDFLVLPSVFTEMYPLVIREALQEGLPVIASAAKGNLEVIKEGKNGFIFEYDNYKDLAHVIDKAYNLKQNGWQPDFEDIKDSEKDIERILYYYS